MFQYLLLGGYQRPETCYSEEAKTNSKILLFNNIGIRKVQLLVYITKYHL